VHWQKLAERPAVLTRKPVLHHFDSAGRMGLQTASGTGWCAVRRKLRTNADKKDHWESLKASHRKAAWQLLILVMPISLWYSCLKFKIGRGRRT